MIDEWLDKLNNYRVKSIKKKSARMKKLYTARKELSDVQSDMSKLNPNSNQKGRVNSKNSLFDTLGEFGERCSKASERINNNMWGNNQEK